MKPFEDFCATSEEGGQCEPFEGKKCFGTAKVKVYLSLIAGTPVCNNYFADGDEKSYEKFMSEIYFRIYKK